MEGTLGLRNAGPADAQILHDLQRLSPGVADWSAEDYEEILLQEGTLCLLAEEQPRNHGVGFLLGRTMADEMEILNLAVIPDYRRRGIARRLVEKALDRARACGVSHCWLEVRASNQAARDFYRAAGFEEYSRRSQYYCNPREDAVVCVHPLEASSSPVLPSRRGAGDKGRL